MKRPQEIGRVHETYLAKTLGGSVVPGSGNQWYAKLDVEADSIIFSCKATNAKSMRIDRSMIDEMQNAAHGLMGQPGTIGAMSVWLEGGECRLIVLMEQDFIWLCEGQLEISFKPTKTAEKIAKGKIPTLMRETDG